MATVDEIFRLLKYRATKLGFNGSISPDDFNLIWPRSERRHFNNLYKQYELTQEVGESLLPFKTNPIAMTLDVDGKYTKPSDLLHIDSVRALFNNKQVPVERVTDDRLGNKLSSEYNAPSLQFPIYVDYNSYLQMYPVTTASPVIVYLQELVNTKWGYTLVGGRPEYNPATSVQPKWSDDDIDEICYIALSDIGIAMRDGQVQQFAEQKIKTNL